MQLRWETSWTADRYILPVWEFIILIDQLCEGDKVTKFLQFESKSPKIILDLYEYWYLVFRFCLSNCTSCEVESLTIDIYSLFSESLFCIQNA